MKLKVTTDKVFIDFHGYYQVSHIIPPLLQQIWEMGKQEVVFIHGHGRNRGKRPGVSGTNTGRLGIQIRRQLVKSKKIRQWISYSTVNRSERSSTSVHIKRNRNPSRSCLVFTQEPWNQ